mmetsp:Transcript_1270/g.3354  ORF Transcript_1270/g.3354 Transcript_1270/m.3354 type:complete len:211 (+) Transcript_1270:364-996(+)
MAASAPSGFLAAASAELHLVHENRQTSEQLVLVVRVSADGPDSGLLAKLGFEARNAPEAHATTKLGQATDFVALAAAVGGLGAARYEGLGASPPCRRGAGPSHRLIAEGRLQASPAELTALACALSPSPQQALMAPARVAKVAGPRPGALRSRAPSSAHRTKVARKTKVTKVTLKRAPQAGQPLLKHSAATAAATPAAASQRSRAFLGRA